MVGPTMLGPESFAQAGYDYVGFDCQHGYLDDADVALLLSRLENVPIATAVRLPSTAPAPIGRVLDAGADAIIVAMIETAEQAADAVAATRFAPDGVRSFGPLRASLGHDVAALESTGERLRDGRDRPGLAAVDEICAVPGLSGIYVGPADLAISMGHDARRRLASPGGARRDGVHPGRATAAGLVAGVHAGDGAIGKHRRPMGFRMITLASESQALRHGAARHLAAASGDRGDEPT